MGQVSNSRTNAENLRKESYSCKPQHQNRSPYGKYTHYIDICVGEIGGKSEEYCINGTRSTQKPYPVHSGIPVDQQRESACSDSRDEVEEEKLSAPHSSLYSYSEEKKPQHVEKYMGYICMDKHVGNYLPEKPVLNDQNGIHRHVPTGSRRDIIDQENKYIYAYKDKGCIVIPVYKGSSYYRGFHTRKLRSLTELINHQAEDYSTRRLLFL